MIGHQASASTTMSTEKLWHQRYGNLNHNDFMLLQRKTMVEGIPIMKNNHVECEACALGKQHRDEFLVHEEKRQRERLRTYSDLHAAATRAPARAPPLTLRP